MTDEEVLKYINATVEKTVAALKRSGMIKNADDMKYADISYMLMDYYQNGQAVPKVEKALNEVKYDAYFEIIPLYFGDGLKMDEIAKQMNVDVSTIVRNKKRLCLQVYTLMI